jgi:hypothetical protein
MDRLMKILSAYFYTNMRGTLFQKAQALIDG